jgi:hypothetical protein
MPNLKLLFWNVSNLFEVGAAFSGPTWALIPETLGHPFAVVTR